MILVYADHDRGELDPLALQVVSAARALDADVHALIVGPNAEKCFDDLASAGVRLQPLWHGSTLKQVRDNLDQAFFGLSTAYYDRRVP